MRADRLPGAETVPVGFSDGAVSKGLEEIAEFRPISIIHGAKFLRLVISAHMTSIDERAKDERRGIE